jgi:hypothetical protein
MDADIHFKQAVQNEEKNAEENDWHEPMTEQKAMISTTDAFIFAPKTFTDPLYKMLKRVDDNWLFQLGRKLGKPGLVNIHIDF